MPGLWHTNKQDFFGKEYQEIQFSYYHDNGDQITLRNRRADVYCDETVIEYQHSRITLEEVNSRNVDYGDKLNKRVVWILDCTKNKSKPIELSENLWLLDFEKKWQIESMKDCSIVFADFGTHIFIVPMSLVKYRMVTTCSPWTWDEEFKKACISYQPEYDIPQSTLTVAQDPHGSGKTFRLTNQIIYDEDHYDTQIVVTKSHAQKDVVFTEFMKNLEKTDFHYTKSEKTNKYIIKFTKSNGQEVLCIFGTADSLMYNIGERKINGTDCFVDLVKSIHEFGPTKLQGPKGRFNYAGEKPRANKKTKIIVDEATMLTEDYMNALSTIMNMCSCDVHLAGDVQQSTLYKKNVLIKIMEEFNIYGNSIPSFSPTVKVNVVKGNEVRRFGDKLVGWKNIVMIGFIENPSHNLQIPIPIAAYDVVHERGIASVELIEKINVSDGAESEEVKDSIEIIMAKFIEDAQTYNKLPYHFIIITPFVKNNPLMDELQTAIHEYWNRQFNNDEWRDKMRSIYRQEFDTLISYFENMRDGELDWKCVLHRSEEGKPINTRESEYATRIVSIQASQGDGRDISYVVGLTEYALKRFSGDKIDIQYESLLNVAISRMKEIVRVFLEPTFDDIFQRFIPVMSEELITKVPPKLFAKSIFKFEDINIDTMKDDYRLLNIVKNKIEFEEHSEHDKPLVDYDHHTVRMAVANTIIHANIVSAQSEKNEYKQQVFTILKIFTECKIISCDSKQFYSIYRKAADSKIIPVLYYNDGRALFKETHDEIIKILNKLQLWVRQWVAGQKANFNELKPQDAVVLQYAIEVIKLYPYYKEEIRMDHVYDVVACYMKENDESKQKLQRHYDYIKNIQHLYEQIISMFDDGCQWKILRSIKLGNKKNGHITQHFQLTSLISHMIVDETRKEAVPIMIVPDVNEINISDICCRAIIYTLVCTQPEQKESEDKTTPTWKYVKDKKIKICIAPIKQTKPIFVDLTDIVEENIELLSEWVKDYVDEQLRLDLPKAYSIADYYENDFDTARDIVRKAYEHKPPKCPEYMYEAFQDVEYDGVKEELERELEKGLKRHLKRFKRDVQNR